MKSTGSQWLEPESAFNDSSRSKYPFNNMTQTESGHTFEMDDTPGRERVRLQHRKETFIEMHPNGDQVIKVQGDSYEITIKDKNITVFGQCNITVHGDTVIDCKGSVKQYVAKDYELLVEGDYTQVVKGSVRMVSDGDIDITANPNVTGQITLSAGGQVSIHSDLFVTGQIAGNKIISETRVDAGLGVSAGRDGFVSITGGLSIGIPIALPLTILCAGLINSGTVVSAPIGAFGTMSAGLMTDYTNTKIYNTHTHPAPKGTTGIPNTLML